MNKRLALVLVALLALTTLLSAQQPVRLVDSNQTPQGTAGNPVRTDTTGTTTQPVNCVAGCSSSPAPADNSAFTSGTSTATPVQGFYESSPSSITAGRIGAVGLTQKRALFTAWFNSSGVEMGTSGNPVRTDPTGTTTQPVSAASLPLPSGAATSANQSTEVTALQLIDNPVGSSTGGTAGTSSFLAGGIYNSSPITLTNGQQSGFQFDANGYAKVNIAAGSAAGGTSSSFGSSFPSAGTAMGLSDGTNMRPGLAIDGDSGGGTQYIQGANLRFIGSGGSVEAGTGTHPFKVVNTDSGGNELAQDPPVQHNVAATRSTLTNAAMICVSDADGDVTDVGGDDRGVAVTCDLDGSVFTKVRGSLPAGANAIGKLAANSGVDIGDVDVTSLPALAAGANLVGQINTVATATTTNSGLPCYITSAASTNATNCKASPGNLYGYEIVNTTATLYYLRLYNLSSAPTCSSATGFVRTIPIPASATGAGITRDFSIPEGFTAGIGFCVTAGGSSTDNTSAATGVYLTLLYK